MISRLADWLASRIPPLTAFQLGVVRVLFACALGYIVFDRQVPEDPFPPELHLRVHALADMDWVHALAANPPRVARLEQAIFALLALFGVGLLTRLSYVALTITLTIWSLVWLTHTGAHPWAVMLVTIWALVPVRWGQAFSLDALVRRRTVAPATEAANGWALWVPGLVFGTAMAGAAVAKLAQGGFAWMTNGTVKYFFVIDAVRAPTEWGLWIASHHRAAVALSFGAILAEGTIVLAVLFRSYLARLPFALMGLGLLGGFYAFQNEVWPAWWALYLMFFVPWPHLIPRRYAGTAEMGTVPISAGHVAIAVIICALQIVASAGRFEFAPLMSDYPMYSKTYASIEEFERANGLPPQYGFAVAFADGAQQDASDVFERLELDGPVRDAYIAVNEKRPEAREAARTAEIAARRLTEHYGKPVVRITVLIDQRGFNWETGTFGWRAQRQPVHTFEVPR